MKRFTILALAIGGGITASIGAGSIFFDVEQRLQKRHRERAAETRREQAWFEENNRAFLLALEAYDRGED